jgi:AraC-like DNA-binding protein
MPTRSITQSAQVVVAHACPVLAAGLVTSLRRLPGCDVQLWGGTSPALPVPEGPGTQIVIGDRDFVAGLLARRSREPGAAARLVIVHSQREDASGDRPGLPDGVDASLTVPCAEQEFFALVRRLCGAGAPATDSGGLAPGLLRRVLARIECSLDEGTPLAELARMAGLSEGHFSRAFKRSVGLPPHRWVLHRRVAAAARRLADDDASLSDIALSLGFSDQSLFTRQFAALTGVTPGAYRRGLRARREVAL